MLPFYLTQLSYVHKQKYTYKEQIKICFPVTLLYQTIFHLNWAQNV